MTNQQEGSLNTSPEAKGLTTEQKIEIRKKLLDFSSNEALKFNVKEEQEWVDSLYSDYKKNSLTKIFENKLISYEGHKGMDGGNIAALEHELKNRIFLALSKNDQELVKESIMHAHSILNGVTKITHDGEKATGCICDECANLSILAKIVGEENLAESIIYGTYCPSYSLRNPVDLSDLISRDNSDEKTPDEYEKELQHKIDWYLKPKEVRKQFNEQFKLEKLDKLESSLEGDKSITGPLKLIQSYAEIARNSYTKMSFGDPYAEIISLFPGKIETMEVPDKLEEKDLLKCLEKIDENFTHFRGVYYHSDEPLAAIFGVEEKGDFGSSNDFLDLPDGDKNEIISKLDNAYEKAKEFERTHSPGSRDLEEAIRTCEELALISSLFAHLGQKEKAISALKKAKERANLAEGELRDYNGSGGEKYLTIALAEIANQIDPTESLQRAEGKYMAYLGGPETYEGISPSTRMDGLQNIAKIKVIAGLDPLPTIIKLKEKTSYQAFAGGLYKQKSAEDFLFGVTEATIKSFELWAQVRSKVKQLKLKFKLKDAKK